MEIEQFIAQSEGQWRSMRSGHSLAFKQFEQIISQITIKILKKDDPMVLNLLKTMTKKKESHASPFIIEWEAETEWIQETADEGNSGCSLLIPIPKTNST